MLFLCPKCKKELKEEDKRCVCPDGHSYDRAKEGYYNFLLGGGGTHGDNRDMVTARRTFLSLGYYEPLSKRLSELVLEYTSSGSAVLDAGSGEGYYTDIIERELYSRDGESFVSGFDISKEAVRFAAKKNSRISYAVATSYHMPIPDSSVDTLVNVFSPLALSETTRVLKRGGKFIMAIPDKEHLFELKAAVYDTPYKNEVEDTELEGFSLIKEEALRYNMALSSPEAIEALFMMTPYAYRTKPENRGRLRSCSSLDCRAEFILLVYEKI